MRLEGKLDGRATVAATAGPGLPGRLGLLVDEGSSLSFLVDSGAVFSVLPYSSTEPANGPAITSANGTPIPCWGVKEHVLKAAGRSYKWTFLLAAVAFPILGADFLQQFDLLVDLKRGRLINGGSPGFIQLKAPPINSVFATIGVQPAAQPPAQPATAGGGKPTTAGNSQLTVGTAPPPSLQHRLYNFGSTTSALQHRLYNIGSTTAVAGVYSKLLVEFPAVLNPSKVLPEVKHKVWHHIETEGRPVAAKYRRLDADKLAAARRDFLELEKQGVVRRSSSNWASPLHMVRKSDGSWRPCGDFRRLNLQTKPDLYTCPNIGDLTSRLAGCTVFSKLDLRKGYHQVPVRPEDVAKTAIITPFGLWEFLRMPFGLRNAGQTFQRMMDDVLAGLEWAFCYMDDVLIASRNHQEHEEHLREVFRRFELHGLVLNGEKCQLGMAELDYLGHHVSASGITPIKDKVAAINNFPRPDTVKQLQTFLGMLNFYRRFLPQAAAVLKPLTEVLQGGTRGRLTWTEDMAAAFKRGKEAIVAAVELAHPDPAAVLSLAVDASDSHVGAVLQQQKGREVRPLAFFSVKLDKAQSRYSAFDRELLAVYLGIRHFRWLLEGRQFHVLSDHKPLSFALHRLTDAWSARQQRHLSFIAEYTSDIRHIAGKANVVADALSRPAAAVVAPATRRVDYTAMATEQGTCVEVLALRENPSLDIQELAVSGVQLWCDVSTGVLRPLVPVQQRRRVVEAIHGLAHPGIRASKRLITSKFLWKGCAADIAAWCRECQGCSRGKVTVQESTAAEVIPVSGGRFSHVHVDIVGPLPVSAAGSRYLLTVVDRTTRWPEAVPLRDITAVTCADAFAHSWVARFGVPESVTTDRGTQFSGAVWRCLCDTLGIHHIMTTAYHPQSNGLVERFHRQLKEALQARECGAGWEEHLPWVLLGLRAAPKEVSGVSSAEAVYGTPVALPGQAQTEGGLAVTPPPPVIPARQLSYAEVTKEGHSILEGVEYVYVRRGPVGGGLQAAYSGPYRVLGHAGKVYELQVGERVEKVAADRLKPHLGSAPAVARPPPRGRPLGTSGSG